MNPESPPPALTPPPPAADCLLTLAAPRALEEELSDALLEQPALVPGFSLVPSQGVGQNLALATAMEQVQGRAQRVLVQVAMRQTDVEPLLQHLRSHFGGAQITFWVLPLLAFGRFA